jgi:cell division protein FtsB
MELDLSTHRPLLVVLACVLLLVGFGWLGHACLPSGDRLLTLSEWQVLQASRAYQKELAQLRASAESLAELINTLPDPVRAQLLAENIARLASHGQPALVYQRDKLTQAAKAISDWAVGALDREGARFALQAAIQALSPEPFHQDDLSRDEARH